MYVPRVFAEPDLSKLDYLIERDPFVTLITVRDGVPEATHLPILYRRDGERIVIRGHWARANPQARHAGPALLIVHGPHAYISPGWYADKEPAARVPTWNYAVAHLHGTLTPTDDEAELAAIVDALSVREETAIGSDWRFEPERDDHRRQLRGIVGFSFAVERVELKFKLNQNHPAANIEGAARGLAAQARPQAHEIAALMRTQPEKLPHP